MSLKLYPWHRLQELHRCGTERCFSVKREPFGLDLHPAARNDVKTVSILILLNFAPCGFPCRRVSRGGENGEGKATSRRTRQCVFHEHFEKGRHPAGRQCRLMAAFRALQGQTVSQFPSSYLCWIYHGRNHL